MQFKDQPIRVNIVAYNEELFIEKCLDSIKISLAYASQENAIVSIIVNGSSDKTFDIANSYCSNLSGWSAHEVKIGDKANAWNYGVQLVEADEHPFTVYVDGDCTISQQAISALIETYTSQPNSYIIAAVPGTKGNSTEEAVKRIVAGKALSGNFYALTPTFLKKVANEQFLLPIGLIGDDSLLAWVSSHDFKQSNGDTPGFLVGSKDATFYYYRLVPNSISNIKLYIRRIYRYSLRHLQQSCIRELVNETDQFSRLPRDIHDIYKYQKIEHIRTNSIYGLFDVINYLSMKKSR